MQKNQFQQLYLWLGIFVVFLAASAVLAFLFHDTKPYKPMTEDEGLVFQISFDFPRTWEWSRDFDNTFGTLFAFSPYEDNEEGNKAQVVLAVVLERTYKVPIKGKMEGNIDWLISTRIHDPDVKNLEDQEYEIDGHYARKIRYLKIQSNTQRPPGIMIEENIFILDADRYYWLVLDVPESERDGKFGKDFDELVESIKILP